MFGLKIFIVRDGEWLTSLWKTQSIQLQTAAIAQL